MSEPAISLARYAAFIGYRPCAFNGIRNDDDEDYSCSRVWTKSQRDMIERSLREAQEELEQEIGYFLAPSWVEDERLPYRSNLRTRWGHVIAGGVLSDTVIGNSVAPNYAADPATVTAPLGTCDPEDVHVYLEDTDIEVTPSGYTTAGGNIIFSIPWCRLVAEAYLDNPEAGWDYADVATWRAPRVDVRCRANSTATQAEFIWRQGHACTCSLRGCSDHRHDGCIYVRNAPLGTIDVTRADYSAGTWTAASLSCCEYYPDWVELHYYSGLQVLTRQAEDAIIRLAHSKMPDEPCGCEVTQRYWKRDRNTPQVMTRERINCPFGMSDGAWTAYRFAATMRLVRGGQPL